MRNFIALPQCCAAATHILVRERVRHQSEMDIQLGGFGHRQAQLPCPVLTPLSCLLERLHVRLMHVNIDETHSEKKR